MIRGVRGLFLVGCLCLVCVWILLLKVPLFHVQNIYFLGNNFVETKKLARYVDSLQPLSWVSVRWGSVSRQILSEFPPLASIETSGKFPESIQFYFSEKEPWLVFYVEQDIVVIASDGSILSQGEEMPLTDGEVVVRGVPSSFFSERGLNQVFLKTLSNIVDSLESHFPFDNLQIILDGLYLEESGYQMLSWTLIKDDSIEIWMGDLLDLSNRFKALTQFFSVLSPPEEAKIDYIDMRVPTKLIIGYEAS